MKKRLRKKLHKGEFQELGFEVRVVLDAMLSVDQIGDFFDCFILEAIESNDLAFGGGGTHYEISGFVVKWDQGSATHEDRARVESWMKSQGGKVVQYQIGNLVDAWYP